MKYPLLRSFADLLPELGQYDAIIDVRSPLEFAEDHVPGAINCPVLNNEERIRVGTLYRQVGAFEAKKLGAALVAKNVAHHIETLFYSHPQSWKPLVYCWRGGNRSGAMAHILAKVGWPVTRIDGGYKAYRSHVNTELTSLPAAFHYQVLCGPTGSGKSRLLRTLVQQGAQVLDLEQLANHRGSVLGNVPDSEQPSQKWFETGIWHALRQFDPDRPVFIEAESKKVGKLRVPDSLMTCMRASACTVIALPLADRVHLLLDEYAHFVQDAAHLTHQLDLLTPLHGKERIAQWRMLAESGEMPKLVEALLASHYDALYAQSVKRNFSELGSATMLPLADGSTQTFEQAAAQLIATAT
ncbi:MAG: tRNA 2-selenouridine(34) synthase MnmH [Oxalicibacterium faecigallinarum]|uniref:tRNA 2-selenouridine(34) synthase MnmH n=1 Tax=Oxalicibacterium faecigallinarum TaxID=573741 RepID=UPI00280961D0|nr:tRNA 2-selenouridine(34) synthase MnmH [Oxalicibacterium faecigallinarum]MDQ7970183.1 tRNA 2-selenouridine(34) synthase MnmH [Oxalicibacterium faecigallinarum]